MPNTIIAQLWELLDEQIEAAIPLQRKIKQVQKDEPGDEVAVLRLQLEKYQVAGFAPGLAQALCTLLHPTYADYKEVVKHAQARYKAKQNGEQIDTPIVPPHKAAAAATPAADNSEESPAAAQPADVDPAPEEQAPAAPKRRPRRTPDPGPDPAVEAALDEQQSGASDRTAVWNTDADHSLDKLDERSPGSKAKVQQAIANARARAAERNAATRPDDTDADRAANHRADLGPVDTATASAGEEQDPDDVAAMLAALEES